MTQSGLDRLVATECASIAGASVGVIANPSSVDKDLRNIVDILASHPACSLKKIFAPEHGFRAALQDMESVDDMVDARTLLPVVSLYGSSVKSLTPTPESL
ncbi:MAG: DUF1343 domain-containing protein, partial [Bdellovibrionales bacterium]|nr:DUF1343 domain-containing protein [Bdellovibrionales bacterium]